MLATTKLVACPDGWTKLTDLYGATTFNGSKFTGVNVSVRTYAVQFAVSDGVPMVALGHPMSPFDSFDCKNENLERIWFKNETASSTGYLAITPEINF